MSTWVESQKVLQWVLIVANVTKTVLLLLKVFEKEGNAFVKAALGVDAKATFRLVGRHLIHLILLV